MYAATTAIPRYGQMNPIVMRYETPILLTIVNIFKLVHFQNEKCACIENLKLGDPAMGSAGFICAAAQYVSEHYAMDLMKTDNKRHYTTTMFSGFDTDQTMLRIGAMNMMLHGVEAPNITWMDSLSPRITPIARNIP